MDGSGGVGGSVPTSFSNSRRCDEEEKEEEVNTDVTTVTVVAVILVTVGAAVGFFVGFADGFALVGLTDKAEFVGLAEGAGLNSGFGIRVGLMLGISFGIKLEGLTEVTGLVLQSAKASDECLAQQSGPKLRGLQ